MKNCVERKQNKCKHCADMLRKSSPKFKTGDSVWVTVHPVSQAKTSKLIFQRNFHVSDLVLYHEPDARSVAPIREGDNLENQMAKIKSLLKLTIVNQVPAKEYPFLKNPNITNLHVVQLASEDD
ncbi:hypothetical protein CEXT_653071 [Caerostris extrusa]|uniref:Uncharacterized protein n=1 Tax=Caerostris extrusa TaxID=172846 RepID=A0AAV4URE0_CAEEX|nr:hypothetical protein CEXT_653071 [Caerostris extrusa]